MNRYWIIVLAMLSVSAVAQSPGTKAVVQLDPAMEQIVAADVKVEKVADGFKHLEGPVWVRKGGYLLVTDNVHNVIQKWDPRDGKVTTVLENGDEGFKPDGESMLGGPNGMILDPQGRIVYGTRVQHGIVRLEKDGKRTLLVSQYEGKNLNAVNDLVYKKNGSLYFTDPIFGIRERREKNLPAPKWDLPFQGVYLLKGGKLTLLAKDLTSPNGIALSPDEKFLYANDNVKKTIWRYEIQPDDTVANGKIFIDMSADQGPGGPDGMKVDKKGNVYCTGPGGVWVISPEGKALGKLVFPHNPSNFVFGDADGKTFYAGAEGEIYKMRLKVPGAGF